MKFLSFDQIAQTLDPSGELGITPRWLRSQMGSVKMGKRLMVSENEFTAYLDRLNTQCQENRPRPASSGDQTATSTSSDTERAVKSVSLELAQQAISRLKKSSRRFSADAPSTQPNNLIVGPFQSR